MAGPRKHSRTGCLTCKVRKKRCSEDRPICNDCDRLGFTCVYLPKTSNRQVLSRYKAQVEQELLGKKNHRRVDEDEVALDGEIVSLGEDPYLSQPLADPLMSQLDPVGVHLYSYYRTHLAQIISIAPTRQNYYLQVFLPMAHQHAGILNGIMAWSAHHLSITTENGEGAEQQRDSSYLELANKYTLKSLERLRSEETNSETFLWTLAQVLVLCAAEICQGDVKKWKILLKFGAGLIEKNVGSDISKLLSLRSSQSTMPHLDSRTRYWLLANFIYHDIMCSQGTFFATEQYRKVLYQQEQETPSVSTETLHLDPLHGINRPILLYLGDITNLMRKMKQSSLPFNKDHPQFREYMEAAHDLEMKLHQAVPNVTDLKAYRETSSDNDLCLHLFRLMQTAALIHLKTTCLKYSKYCLEIQYLWTLLSDRLDLVLGTKLEGSLCFPMFICGINCMDKEQRDLVEWRFDNIMKRYKCYNFQRARIIMRKVWNHENVDVSDLRSDSVSSHSSDNSEFMFDLTNKDWYDIVDEMGWDISFA